jgi:hypothetical protein
MINLRAMTDDEARMMMGSEKDKYRLLRAIQREAKWANERLNDAVAGIDG